MLLLWTACSRFTQQVHSLVTSHCPGCRAKVSSLFPLFVWLLMQFSVISEFLFRNFQCDATGKADQRTFCGKKWCLNLVEVSGDIYLHFSKWLHPYWCSFFPLPAVPPARVLESAHVFPHPMNFSAVNDTIGCGRRRSTFCS